MAKLIRKTYQAAETKALDDSRSLIVTISTVSPDRSGDVVIPGGVKLENYLKNPVVAFAHRYNDLALAKAGDIRINSDSIQAKVTFPNAGISPLSDQVYELYKGGFMNAWSIGFIPFKYADIQNGGRQFTEWELLEFSAVLVPDNPEALTIMRSKGIDTAPLEAANAEATKEEDVTPGDTTPPTPPTATPEGEVVPAEPVKSISYESGVIKLTLVNDTVVELKTAPEFKDGRVLSTKNRELIKTCIDNLDATKKSLQDLYDATEASGDGKSADPDTLAFLKGVQSHLRRQDQTTGLILRTIRGYLKVTPSET
jgi:hypothetical protein